MFGKFIAAVCAAALLALPGARAWAVPSFGGNSDWVLRAWQLEDGLPDSSVTGIAQTADGYLWVGTLGQCVRFDGVSFLGVGLKLESQTVQSLFVDRHDRLWLAMDRAPIVCLEEGKCRIYTPADGLPNMQLRKLVEDSEGAIWVSSSGSAITRIKDGQITNFGQESGVPREGASSLACDQAGQLWFCKHGRVGIFRDGRFSERFRVQDNEALISAARSDGIWVYARNQLFTCDARRGLVKWADLAFSPGTTPKVMLEDRSGAVWLGTVADGLFRCHRSNCVHVATSHPDINCLAEDREGNIWAGTAGGGLNRLSQRILELLGREAGLPFESIASVREDKEGSLWVVTQNDLVARRQGEKWVPLPQTNGWTGASATCVTVDKKGAVWLGTLNSGLFRYETNRFTNWSLTNGLADLGVRSILAASDGSLWVGTIGGPHLQQFQAGRWQKYELPKGSYAIRAMTEDSRGRVWLGSSDGKLLRVNFTNQTAVIEKEGDSIRCLWSTPDGGVWIGHAHTGLGLLMDGHYSLISSKEGLSENSISQILSDGRGWLWIAGTRSIFRVRQQALREVAAGRATRVLSIAYGRGEGLPNLQANFDFFPGATRSRDDLLWFPMRNGLVAVHTENLRRNQKPPMVFLEEVLIDGRPLACSQRRLPQQHQEPMMDLRAATSALHLPPNHHKVEFKFTAFNFAAPDQVMFRYRLEGADENWVEAGGQRTAAYSRLVAGKYRFRIAASADTGVWIEAGDGLEVVVEPFFWQTWWFRLGSVGAFAAVVGVSARSLANRRHQRRLAVLVQQQALERERARIARDLHDDLGSSLTQIGFLIEEFRESPLPAEEVKKQSLLLGNRVHSLARDLDAVVWTVNPNNDSLAGLVAYLSQYFLESLRPTSIRPRLEVDDELPELLISPQARHHLFLIAKEAINNLMKHSGAAEAWLKMSVLDGLFEIRLEDNGRSFSVEAAFASKRHGLRNMKTRTEELGGAFEVSSAPGQKTAVVVRLPLLNNSKL